VDITDSNDPLQTGIATGLSRRIVEPPKVDHRQAVAPEYRSGRTGNRRIVGKATLHPLDVEAIRLLENIGAIVIGRTILCPEGYTQYTQ
jgi:hypothetical protein